MDARVFTHDTTGCTAPVWTSGGTYTEYDGVQRCVSCQLPLDPPTKEA